MKKSKIAVSLFALCMLATSCNNTPNSSSSPVNDSTSDVVSSLPNESSTKEDVPISSDKDSSLPESSTKEDVPISSGKDSSLPESSKEEISSDISSSSQDHEDSSSSSSPSVEKYALNASCDEGAEIEDLATEAVEGEIVTFHVTLKEEKLLSYVTVDQENVLEPNQDGSYSFTMPKNDVTIAVVTADKTYTNSVAQLDKATISVSPSVCKKGDTVTIRITTEYALLGDPMYKLDDGEGKAMEKVSENTYTATYIQPGKDVNVTVTTNEKPSDAVYKIIDAADDGVLVKVKDNAKAGEKIFFTLGLEQGYDFLEENDVEVSYLDNGEKVPVDVTVEDGKYTFVMPEHEVTITRKTKKAIYEVNVISDEEENPSLTLIEGENTSSFKDHYAFGTTVTFAVADTDKYTASTITVNNGEPIAKDEDNHFKFKMPAKATEIKINYVLRQYDFKLNDDASTGITLKAYKKTKENTYEEILDNKTAWDEKVYIKALVDENHKDYLVDTLEATMNHDSFDKKELNEDSEGYYSVARNEFKEDSNSAKILNFTVKGTIALFSETNPIANSAMNAVELSTYYSFSKSSFSLEIKRNGRYTSTNVFYNTTKTSSGKATKDSDGYITSYHPQSNYNESYKYTDTSMISENGIISTYSVYGYSDKHSYFFLSGCNDSTSLASNSKYIASSVSNEGFLKLSDGNKTAYAIITKQDNKPYKLNPFDKIEYKNEIHDMFTSGSIFELRYGETSLGFYKNTSNVITKLEKKDPVTYTNAELGDIKLDGLCNATIKEDGQEVNASYSMSDEHSLAITYKGNTSYYYLNTETKTYTEFSYVAKTFFGAQINVNGTPSNFQKKTISLGSDLSLSVQSGSSTPDVYSIYFNEDGTISAKSTDKTVSLTFSKDKSCLVVIISTKYSSQLPLLVTSNFTKDDTYKAVNNVSSASGDSKNGLFTLYKDDSKNYSVFFNKKEIHFGSVDTLTYTAKDESRILFTEENGNQIHLKAGSSEPSILENDNFGGTYTNDTSHTLGEINIDGYGLITVGGKTYEYTVSDKENKVITYTTDEDTFTITLNGSTYTYTAKSEETIDTLFFQGKTYTYDGIYNDSSKKLGTMKFVFDAKEKNVTYTTKSSYSKSVEYTVKDNTISFKISYSDDTSTPGDIEIVFDTNSQKLSIEKEVKIEQVYDNGEDTEYYNYTIKTGDLTLLAE